MNNTNLAPFWSSMRLFASILLLAFFMTDGELLAQDVEQDRDPLHDLLTTRRVSECDDYIFNAQRFIPDYHRKEQFDSVDLVIDYVSEHCSTNPFETYLLLRDMLMGAFPPDWCDDELAGNILMRRYMSLDCFHMSGLVGSFEIFSADTSYRGFVHALAVDAAAVSDTASFSHAAAVFLSGDQPRVITNLSHGQYRGTCLQNVYDRRLDSLVRQRENFVTNWSVNGGVWIPQGPIEVLGTKAELGGQAGLRTGRFGADASLLFRFIDTDKPWSASHNGRLYETKYFHSIYIGLEPNFTVYSGLGSRLELFAGGGWDGLLGLTADVIDEEYGDYQNSYNINFGLTQRFFYGTRRNWYLGVQARYNIVDYDTDGGTDISGNTISVNLIWGCMGHGWVDDELEWLGYFGM